MKYNVHTQRVALPPAAETRRAPRLAALRTLPRVTPVSRPEWATPGDRRGYAYEKKVGKILKSICDERGWVLWDHQWFLYSAAGTTQYFQPDFIIERPKDLGIIVEVKLTYVDTAEQLNKYLKYLKFFGLVCFPVTVVRHLTPAVEKTLVVDDFIEVKSNSIWHLWV